jgi:hypothetical protein
MSYIKIQSFYFKRSNIIRINIKKLSPNTHTLSLKYASDDPINVEDYNFYYTKDFFGDFNKICKKLKCKSYKKLTFKCNTSYE